MRPPSQKRTLAFDRLKRIRELRVQGFNQYQIADKLAAEGLGRITQQAISKALLKQDRRVAATLVADDRERKAQQLEKLEFVYAEAVQAWLKSKEAYRMLREKEQLPEEFHPPADGAAAPPQVRRGRKETVQELRDQHGERGFLTEARDALADIRKLLGLNAPDKHEHEIGQRDHSHVESLRGKLLSGASEN